MKTPEKFKSALIVAGLVLIIVIAASSYLSFTPKKTTSEDELEIKVATTTDIVVPSLEVPKSGSKTAPEPVAPVSKWQVYENKQYKFSFSYPTGWTVSSKASTGGVLISLSICPPKGSCPFLFFVTPKGSEGSNNNNKVVWKRADYTYELDYVSAGYDDLYEEILTTFKFQ